VTKPLAVCGVGLIVIIACVVLMITQKLMTVIDSTGRDFLVWSDVKVYQWDKQEQAEQILKESGGNKQYPYRKSEF